MAPAGAAVHGSVYLAVHWVYHERLAGCEVRRQPHLPALSETYLLPLDFSGLIMVWLILWLTIGRCVHSDGIVARLRARDVAMGLRPASSDADDEDDEAEGLLKSSKESP